MQRSAQTA